MLRGGVQLKDVLEGARSLALQVIDEAHIVRGMEEREAHAAQIDRPDRRAAYLIETVKMARRNIETVRLYAEELLSKFLTAQESDGTQKEKSAPAPHKVPEPVRPFFGIGDRVVTLDGTIKGIVYGVTIERRGELHETIESLSGAVEVVTSVVYRVARVVMGRRVDDLDIPQDELRREGIDGV